MNENIFQNVFIIYTKALKASKIQANRILELFNYRGIKSSLLEIDELRDKASFVIVIGGDGTILKAARFYSQYDTAIFGVNLGRLGFLSQVKPEDIEYAIEKLIDSQFIIDKRIMLCVKDTQFIALNDIVIKGDNISRTSRFYIHINNKPVCDYLADGVIISTPTGSTAYTLSAGGPVIEPSLNVFVIVPICPHTLNSRPLVIPSNESVMVSTSQDCLRLHIVADGQNVMDIQDNKKNIIIQKSLKYAKLVLLKDERQDFYSVLRKKLHWGISPNA